MILSMRAAISVFVVAFVLLLIAGLNLFPALGFAAIVAFAAWYVIEDVTEPSRP